MKTATKRAAVNPSAPIPELDERFDDQLKVNPIIVEKVGEIGTDIARKFNVIKGKHIIEMFFFLKKKLTRIQWM